MAEDTRSPARSDSKEATVHEDGQKRSADGGGSLKLLGGLGNLYFMMLDKLQRP